MTAREPTAAHVDGMPTIENLTVTTPAPTSTTGVETSEIPAPTNEGETVEISKDHLAVLMAAAEKTSVFEKAAKDALFAGKVPEGELGEMVVNGYNGPATQEGVAQYLGKLGIEKLNDPTQPDTSSEERLENLIGGSTPDQLSDAEKKNQAEFAVFANEGGQDTQAVQRRALQAATQLLK